MSLKNPVLKTPPQMGPSYKVIELLDRSPITSRDDKEIQESIATLGNHPGFQHLIKRLTTQKALLKAKLEGERHTDMQAVSFLQAGIYWANWLNLEVARATKRPVERLTDPFEDELEAFKAIDSMIERVGNE